ncbi:hypothetical protein HDV00_003040 [Rhizophlyctis rosea]|nr:hypothetical protein HDV00_003040 [Rhizophlyctis rosea]
MDDLTPSSPPHDGQIWFKCFLGSTSKILITPPPIDFESQFLPGVVGLFYPHAADSIRRPQADTDSSKESASHNQEGGFLFDNNAGSETYRFHMWYLDGDGDRNRLSSQEELDVAVELFVKLRRSFVHVFCRVDAFGHTGKEEEAVEEGEEHVDEERVAEVKDEAGGTKEETRPSEQPRDVIGLKSPNRTPARSDHNPSRQQIVTPKSPVQTANKEEEKPRDARVAGASDLPLAAEQPSAHAVDETPEEVRKPQRFETVKSPDVHPGKSPQTHLMRKRGHDITKDEPKNIEATPTERRKSQPLDRESPQTPASDPKPVLRTSQVMSPPAVQPTQTKALELEEATDSHVTSNEMGPDEKPPVERSKNRRHEKEREGNKDVTPRRDEPVEDYVGRVDGHEGRPEKGFRRIEPKMKNEQADVENLPIGRPRSRSAEKLGRQKWKAGHDMEDGNTDATKRKMETKVEKEFVEDDADAQQILKNEAPHRKQVEKVIDSVKPKSVKSKEMDVAHREDQVDEFKSDWIKKQAPPPDTDVPDTEHQSKGKGHKRDVSFSKSDTTFTPNGSMHTVRRQSRDTEKWHEHDDRPSTMRQPERVSEPEEEHHSNPIPKEKLSHRQPKEKHLPHPEPYSTPIKDLPDLDHWRRPHQKSHIPPPAPHKPPSVRTFSASTHASYRTTASIGHNPHDSRDIGGGWNPSTVVERHDYPKVGLVTATPAMMIDLHFVEMEDRERAEEERRRLKRGVSGKFKKKAEVEKGREERVEKRGLMKAAVERKGREKSRPVQVPNQVRPQQVQPYIAVAKNEKPVQEAGKVEKPAAVKPPVKFDGEKMREGRTARYDSRVEKPGGVELYQPPSLESIDENDEEENRFPRDDDDIEIDAGKYGQTSYRANDSGHRTKSIDRPLPMPSSSKTPGAPDTVEQRHQSYAAVSPTIQSPLNINRSPSSFSQPSYPAEPSSSLNFDTENQSYADQYGPAQVYQQPQGMNPYMVPPPQFFYGSYNPPPSMMMMMPLPPVGGNFNNAGNYVARPSGFVQPPPQPLGNYGGGGYAPPGFAPQWNPAAAGYPDMYYGQQQYGGISPSNSMHSLNYGDYGQRKQPPSYPHQQPALPQHPYESSTSTHPRPTPHHQPLRPPPRNRPPPVAELHSKPTAHSYLTRHHKIGEFQQSQPYSSTAARLYPGGGSTWKGGGDNRGGGGGGGMNPSQNPALPVPMPLPPTKSHFTPGRRYVPGGI